MRVVGSLIQRRRWLIRRLFLLRSHDDDFSPQEAAKALGIRCREIMSKIEAEEIDAAKRVEYRLTWRTLVFEAMQRWTIFEIYDALGEDADKVLPALLRPETLTIRIPAYLIRMIRQRAKKQGVSVDDFLRWELHDDIASGVPTNEMDADIREAVMFPDHGPAQD